MFVQIGGEVNYHVVVCNSFYVAAAEYVEVGASREIVGGEEAAHMST